jgi:hypothetical protein
MTLVVLCLIVAPVLGLVAANAATNPPGNGPGTLQVVLGAGVPAVLSFLAALLAGNGTLLRAGAWACASVAATGSLLLVLALFVELVIRPA